MKQVKLTAPHHDLSLASFLLDPLTPVGNLSSEPYFDQHVVTSLKNAEVSPTLAISELSAKLKCAGKDCYPLGLGQSPFPIPDVLVNALISHASVKNYLPSAGLPALREAVAKYYQRDLDLEISADDVVIGPGSKELLFLVQLAYLGTLVLPAPTWVSYAPQAKLVGKQVKWISTCADTSWKIDPLELERVFGDLNGTAKILLLNYPANPTGVSYTSEELQTIAEIAAKHRALVISDEIYSDLRYYGKHQSIATFYPSGTIITGGISKNFGAGGWRLGTTIFPNTLQVLRRAVVAAASETFSCVSAPIQHAAILAYVRDENLEKYLRLERQILAALARLIVKALTGCHIKVVPPDGGFYLFLEFLPDDTQLAHEAFKSGASLCQRLLDDTGVALLPGSCFGRPQQELTARLAFVDFDGSEALAEAAILEDSGRALDEEFVAKYCPRVLKAVTLINNWITRTNY